MGIVANDSSAKTSTEAAPQEQGEDNAVVTAITAIVREADRTFEHVGGGSRHWVRDCFLPLLNQRGWTCVQAAAPSGEAQKDWIEQRLRQEWWAGHGCPIHALYGDDGEMQCNAQTCMKDFKRGPMDELLRHVEMRRLATASAALASSRSGDAQKELRERLKARRKGAGSTPCERYVCTNPDDYGYRSCERCGWAEPEHLIDELVRALAASAQAVSTPAVIAEIVKEMRQLASRRGTNAWGEYALEVDAQNVSNWADRLAVLLPPGDREGQ